jgi:uncharacterized protein (DUF362 family)
MLGIKNHDREAPVALVGWKEGAIEEAISLCDGLRNFDPAMRVLVKPNLVEWVDTFPFPPYGLITTSVVLEGVIKVLKDSGAGQIMVGDGCALNKELGCETHILQKRLGYERLVKRYGVEVVDFNELEHRKLKLGPDGMRISEVVYNCDYMVNLPALKTHNLTRVTLGFKNLKGLLHPKSKRRAHNPRTTVDTYLHHLANLFYPNLTIIDGLYMLERGPMHTGRAHRAELIIAGRDMFSVDLVGTALMGVEPSEVEHLALFAAEHNRGLDVSRVEIKGMSIGNCIRKLEVAAPWGDDDRRPDIFLKQKLLGFEMPLPKVLCTGCSFVFPNTLMMILAANKGVPFGDLELLAGKSAVPSGKAQKTFLLGDCPVAEHKDNGAIKEAVPITGCPPRHLDVVEALNAHGVEAGIKAVERYFRHLVTMYEELGFPKDDYYMNPIREKEG